MRVATWNVNGLRARFDLLRLWLDARQPDLVALEELKLEDRQFPHAELEALGYRAACHGQPAWNGVAVLAREGLAVTQVGLPGQAEAGARLLAAAAGGVEMVAVYCPNGKDVDHPDFPRKLAWFDALAGFLEQRRDPARPLLLAGDLNLCPGPLDSFDPAGLEGTLFHTDAERSRLRRLLDWGLVDLFRQLEPEARGYTWWDYRAGAFHRNLGLRIDLVLGTAPVAARLRSVEVDRDFRKKRDGLTPSDHAPVVAELA